MLMQRINQKEIMDDVTITDHRIVRALDELRIVNKFLGGNHVSAEGVTSLAGDLTRAHWMKAEMPHTAPTTILDIGSGGSDALNRLAARGGVRIISLDLNTGVCAYVHTHDRTAEVICGNALTLPVRHHSVDIVHASLFLHHLTETEIEHLLRQSLCICRLGIVINDLRRSFAAYAGIWLLTRLFGASPMVRHDGPLSVRRGFSRRDLSAILDRLPAASYSIHRRWAFRWLVVVRKEAITIN